VRFERCSFVGTAGLRIGPGEIAVRRCLFRDSPNVAISSAGSRGSAQLTLEDTRIERCQAGVRLHGGLSHTQFIRDTVEAVAGTGIELTGGAIILFPKLQDVVVRKCGGDGVKIDASGSKLSVSGCTFSDNAGDGLRFIGPAGYPEFALALRGSIVARNGGAGVRLHSRESPWYPDSVVQNTVVQNGAEGILVASASGIARLNFENNIVAGNGGAGIRVVVPYQGFVQRNNAWMNQGPAYEGIGSEPNLTEDPRFCDALAGDYHVASSSPCAPSGPYGQIGALGVACEASKVTIDVLSGSSPNGINTSRDKWPVGILSHALFDARQVDVSSVRLEGAVASGPAQIRDVNGDGRLDLVTRFDAEDLPRSPGTHEVTLEARTSYGAPLQGTDTVTVRGRHGALKATPLDSPDDLSLAVQAPNPFTLRGLASVEVILPATGPATLRLLDVAGRVVAVRDWEATLGAQTVSLSPVQTLRPGVYWLRLVQTDRQVTKKVCLMH
jgi:hypothetical protein